jgi:hypothetical protein
MRSNWDREDNARDARQALALALDPPAGVVRAEKSACRGRELAR